MSGADAHGQQHDRLADFDAGTEDVTSDAADAAYGEEMTRRAGDQPCCDRPQDPTGLRERAVVDRHDADEERGRCEYDYGGGDRLHRPRDHRTETVTARRAQPAQ